MITSLIMAGGLILFGYKPIGKGLVLGSIFSIINFVLMGRALPIRLTENRKKNVLVSLGSIWFRYVIMAIPLVIAFYSESLDFFAAAAGLFMIQFIILAHHLGGMVFNQAPYR